MVMLDSGQNVEVIRGRMFANLFQSCGDRADGDDHIIG